MKLNFCGDSPQQKYFRIGVVGNNLVDELIMSLDRKQGDISLADFKPFIKIVSYDLSFADKTQHFIFDTDSDPDKVIIYYKFPEKVTRQHNVDMQLLFQKPDGDDTIVWQSEIFNVTFEESVNADGVIAQEYPDALLDLEKRVGTLEVQGSGVTECIDRAHFPDVGEANVVYIDVTDGALYRYDTTRQTYFLIGLNPDDIKIINANGG